MVWDELPEGWEVVSLGSVVLETERRNPTESPDAPFMYIEISSVDNEIGTIVDPRELWGREAPTRARKVVRSGDVIFANTRPYLRNIALVPNQYDDQICSTGFCVLRANRELAEPLWLYYLCRSDVVLDQVLPKMRGASYPAVIDSDVLMSEIPLPPLPEQRRIVARIEELTERIDATRRLRAEAAEEAAAILPTALTEVFGEAEEKGWEIKRLREICESKERRNPTKTPNLSFKYVDISSVDNSLLKIVGHKDYLGKEAPSRARKVIRTNDVIFATTRPYLRSIAMVPAEYDDQICSTGFCVLRATKVVKPKWIFYCVQSRGFMDHVLPLMRGSSYPAVTDRDLLGANIPLPSLPEQRRIVEYLDAVQAKVEAIHRYQEETQQEIEAMTGAVLERAFRGEL